DCANGYRTYTYDNGDKYVGELVNGNFHGQGILTYSDGSYDVVFFEEGEAISWKCFDKYGNERDCE
ncbi:MAG: molecular chaperone Tir, partial [Flavobacteriales bacterium]|nr:molecular chaperone Tir [Flavobacteriales bacterium]